MRFTEFADPCYKHVAPLLLAMRDSMERLHVEGDAIVKDLEKAVGRGPLLDHISELRDGTAMVALRAKQVGGS